MESPLKSRVESRTFDEGYRKRKGKKSTRIVKEESLPSVLSPPKSLKKKGFDGMEGDTNDINQMQQAFWKHENEIMKLVSINIAKRHPQNASLSTRIGIIYIYIYI